MVTASIPTLKGGSVNKVSLMKGGRLAEIAWQCGLPTINLNQSAGADLSQQEKVFHKGGASFRELARRSKAGLPSVCVVFGNCTAGGAYSAGMSDYCIMVKNQAKVFLGGPPLVKMATGEVVDDETLGGAEMHSKISGLADYLAQNEHDALDKAREVVALLNWKKKTPIPREHFLPVEEPLYSPDELLGVVGANIRVPFDAREVIARLVDGSRMHEFKPLFGSTLITCWAHLHGIQVGFMANNGVLFSDAAQKGTQFILMCNQKRVPLIYLQNITGFMVGREAEQAGIIKHGSQLINAVSNSTVQRAFPFVKRTSHISHSPPPGSSHNNRHWRKLRCG
jgi:acyl-CoA carboxylase subunit beta